MVLRAVMYIVSSDDIQMKQHRMESHYASKGQNMYECRNGVHPMLLYCSLFYSYGLSSSLRIQQGVFMGAPVWQKINMHLTESHNFNG